MNSAVTVVGDDAATSSVAASSGRVHYDRARIEEALPHRGLALVIDEVICVPDEGKAEGFFRVPEDHLMVQDHFGLMPGVFLGEVAHLSGAVLHHSMYPSSDKILLLSASFIRDLAVAVRPTDQLKCFVSLHAADGTGREASFDAEIFNQYGKRVVCVEFTGMIVSKKLLERQERERRRLLNSASN